MVTTTLLEYKIYWGRDKFDVLPMNDFWVACPSGFVQLLSFSRALFAGMIWSNKISTKMFILHNSGLIKRSIHRGYELACFLWWIVPWWLWAWMLPGPPSFKCDNSCHDNISNAGKFVTPHGRPCGMVCYWLVSWSIVHSSQCVSQLNLAPCQNIYAVTC